MLGLMFYDKNGKCVLDIGTFDLCDIEQEIILSQDERLLGVRS